MDDDIGESKEKADQNNAEVHGSVTEDIRENSENEAMNPPATDGPTASSSRPRRSKYLNSKLCPCFSPCVSDDDGDVAPDTPVAASSIQLPSSSNSHVSNPVVRNSLISMAREFRARFALAADTRNQQRGPFRRMNTNVHPVQLSFPHAATVGFQPMVYTSIDFTHILIPDLPSVLKASYYWGVMDRYEAEKLLENKPEVIHELFITIIMALITLGTFLLRDSAQSDYLFSVSFRRYQRTLHARIEHLDNKFSFDIHDTSIFSAPTITALIENYKDPSKCLFFEPLLCTPLLRNSVFSLQNLCRAVISNNCTYESIGDLPLPHSLKVYLREYHYKQPVQLHVYDPQSGEKFTTAPPSAYFRSE
ncbi:hypothetical protein QR680_004987 [Steinernema hermaphroditum]|uniref:SOCS box domain-containing protein n=1 Tax=Steinernema hermaphroditum TaxID=289476 RepID=A0AA39LUU8_9BILA|nr:hypothetical protein QR680_004987 [Steinernema hermaphroditum]